MAVKAAVVAGDLLPVEADLPAPSRPNRAPRRAFVAAVAIACLLVAALATLAVGHPIAPPLIAAVLIWRARLWRGRELTTHTHLIEQRSVT